MIWFCPFSCYRVIGNFGFSTTSLFIFPTAKLWLTFKYLWQVIILCFQLLHLLAFYKWPETLLFQMFCLVWHNLVIFQGIRSELSSWHILLEVSLAFRGIQLSRSSERKTMFSLIVHEKGRSTEFAKVISSHPPQASNLQFEYRNKYFCELLSSTNSRNY